MSSLDQVRTALKQGDNKTAQSMLADLLQREPQNADAWLLLARALDDPQKVAYCQKRARAIHNDEGIPPTQNYSSEQLKFLGRFIDPQDLDELLQLTTWSSYQTNANEYVQRFVHDGLLESADLAGRLSYKLKASDLKRLLKERGMAVSGRKDALIARLIQASEEDMKRIVGESPIFGCTKQGQILVEHYFVEEREKHLRLEQEILDMLKKHDFNNAISRVWATGESRGMWGISFGGDSAQFDNNNRQRELEILTYIFTKTPTIIKRVQPDMAETLRLAAGMLYLLSNNSILTPLFPPEFATGLNLDNEQTARLLINHAYYCKNLSDHSQSRGKYVTIRNANDQHVCPACQRLYGKKFTVEKVPELPYPECSSDVGCRCYLHWVSE